ncbi:MAG TPA: RDD family protein [Actinomycetes bacterium]|nr:RDD family protein [Actinomycetes bacterium]
MDRDDIGSWLSGPGVARDTESASDYAGQRLGLPESGAGSAAPWGLRIGAIFIDWFVALGITLAVVGQPAEGDPGFSLIVLGVFALEYVVLLYTAGRTLGMVATGLRVLPVGRNNLGIGFVLLRTFLLALVLPAVVYDRDRRGFHDRAGRTVVVRSR